MLSSATPRRRPRSSSVALTTSPSTSRRWPSRGSPPTRTATLSAPAASTPRRRDPGARGTLCGAPAASELLDNARQIYSGGYDEQGVAGFKTVMASEPYRFDFAGDNGVRNTIDNVQMELMDTDFS